MKISFSDKSYLEVIKNANSILITVAAKDPKSKTSIIANTVSLTNEQFQELLKINS